MVEVSLTVGKLDASLALLLTKDHHLIEFPTILLPNGVKAGLIVKIKCDQDLATETEEHKQFLDLQDEILDTFGTALPQPPVLRVKNVTQTLIVLEWDPLDLGTATLKNLILFKDGKKLGAIPQPLTNKTTKLSGLQFDKEFTFQLRLDTTAGTYTSDVITVHTHKMTDLSGITVCLGDFAANEPFTREDIVATLSNMGAHPPQDLIKVDTTHYICTRENKENEEYIKAQEMNIPIVRPEWLKACERERRIVGVRQFYVNDCSLPEIFSKNYWGEDSAAARLKPVTEPSTVPLINVELPLPAGVLKETTTEPELSVPPELTGEETQEELKTDLSEKPKKELEEELEKPGEESTAEATKEAKEEPTEELKDELKEEPKEEPKEEAKEEVKEDLKEEVKVEPEVTSEADKPLELSEELKGLKEELKEGLEEVKDTIKEDLTNLKQEVEQTFNGEKASKDESKIEPELTTEKLEQPEAVLTAPEVESTLENSASAPKDLTESTVVNGNDAAAVLTSPKQKPLLDIIGDAPAVPSSPSLVDIDLASTVSVPEADAAVTAELAAAESVPPRVDPVPAAEAETDESAGDSPEAGDIGAADESSDIGATAATLGGKKKKNKKKGKK